MPATTPNRSTNLLYPPFAARVAAGLAAARAKGIAAHLFEGFRPTERQAYLYAQGRTTDGPVVTWARPGLSFHEYGVAVDLVFDGSPAAGVQWNWEGDYAEEHRHTYLDLAPIMKAHGLEWLGDKKIELAHFEMRFGFKIAEIEQIARARGILGVWAEFDKRLLEMGK